MLIPKNFVIKCVLNWDAYLNGCVLKWEALNWDAYLNGCVLKWEATVHGGRKRHTMVV
jgi:hypothetical protein